MRLGNPEEFLEKKLVELKALLASTHTNIVRLLFGPLLCLLLTT